MSQSALNQFETAAPGGARSLQRLLEHPAAGWIAIFIGAALRLRRYLQDRGVMHDEAQLAANIFSKSFAQLFHPLDLGDQAAPVGFLLLQKISTSLFGHDELAIRLAPFLAAVVAQPLFYVLIRRIGGSTIALLAIAWIALNEHLIYYAAEGKQYSTDVLCCVIILLLAIPARNKLNIITLAITGAVLIWCSHPILFVLGAVGGVLLIEHAQNRNWKLAAMLAVACILWLVSFAINYLLISRHYAASSYLRNYWAERSAFAPIPPRSLADLLWYPKTLAAMFVYPAGISPGDGKGSAISVVAAVVFAIGCAILWKQKRQAFVIILGSLALCLAASAMGKYPFAERLLLFATPLLITGLAFGIGHVRMLPLLRIAIIAILFIYPLYLSGKYAIRPPVLYDAKPAMRYVKTHWQPGDTLYLHWGSDVLGRFYLDTQPDLTIPGAAPIRGTIENDPALRITAYAAQLDALCGHNRVWIVFAMGNQERPLFEDLLNQRGQRLDQDIYAGGAAELYDLH
jgi:hypothetical protein